MIVNPATNATVIDITEEEIKGPPNSKSIVLSNSTYCPKLRTCVNVATLPIGLLLYLPIAISGSAGLASGNNLASFIYRKNTTFHKVLSYEYGLPSAVTISLFNLFSHADFLKFFKRHPLPATLGYGAGLGASVPLASFTYNGLSNYPEFLRWLLAGSCLMGTAAGSTLGIRRTIVSPLLSQIKRQNQSTHYQRRRYTKRVTVIILGGTSTIMGVVTNVGQVGLAIKNLSLGWKMVVGASAIPQTLTFISGIYDSVNPILPDSSGEEKPLLATRRQVGFFEKYLPVMGDLVVPITALSTSANTPWFYQNAICEYDAPIWEKNCVHDWWGITGGIAFITYLATWRKPAKNILGKIGRGMDWLINKAIKPKAGGVSRNRRTVRNNNHH